MPDLLTSLAVQLAPSLAGAAAAVCVGGALAVGVAAAATIARREDAVARVVVVAVVVALALGGITRLPSALSTRDLQWSNQSPLDYRAAEAEVQRANGVDPGFLAFLAERVPPGARFSVVTGPGTSTSAPQSWAQWVLMPRIEEYGEPCAADWVVFYGHPPRLAGARLRAPRVFKPGFSVAKVSERCAP